LPAWLAPEIERYYRENPDAPKMCDGCAYREGTQANGCVSSLMDAIKASAEGEEFYCHKGIGLGDEPKRLCAGFVAVNSKSVESSAGL
jgi:hypothetical protein